MGEYRVTSKKFGVDGDANHFYLSQVYFNGEPVDKKHANIPEEIKRQVDAALGVLAFNLRFSDIELKVSGDFK